MTKDPSSKRAHNFKDLTGQRFNRLTVIALDGIYESPSGTRRAAWICQCDCSKVTVVRTINLTSGEVKSCGCLRNETTIKRNFKHGLTNSPEYTTWQNMISRCYDKKNPSFKYYGQRGIRVCERWHDFVHFLTDMGRKPSPIYTIERINNDGNYEPTNCKWATQKEQSINKSNTLIVTFNNQTKSLIEWSEIININYKVLKDRLCEYGWTVERAFTEEIGKYRKNNIWLVYNGQRKTLSEWAIKTGIRRSLIYHRLKIYKWAIEKALTKPIRKIRSSGGLLCSSQK